MTEPLAPSPAEAMLQTLEQRLAREVEAFAARPVGYDLDRTELIARTAKRLADAARSLVALRTALTRLAQAAAGRPVRADATPAPALSEDASDAPASPANRAERRRAERLESKVRRDLDRLAA